MNGSTLPLLAGLGALAGVGLLLIATARGVSMRRTEGPPALDDHAKGRSAPLHPRSTGREDRRRGPVRLAVAGVTGLVALLVTRWPMALPLGVLAVLGTQGLGGGSAKSTIERLEAIASWTEMLRDTLAGASGLTQALVATAPIAPKAIRPQMQTMAARLNAGVAITLALVELSEDLHEPAADNVVACLVMAASERAQRLADLLGALALATREEVSMRLGIEASRASARTAVRMITGFSFGLLALVALASRSYLSPYGTASGQLVLGFVGCIYGLGLWLMSAMARPEPFPRLPIDAPAQ